MVRVLPSTEENPEITNRTISFTINDGVNAIEGATVTIGDVTSNTGSVGGCTLNNISDGEQTVTVTKEGYVTKTQTITVSEENTTFTISLTEE